MKTDALIASLAADTTPVAPHAVGRRLSLACLAGAIAALALLLVWLGPRPDIGRALLTASFWIKAIYTLTLTLGGALLTARLARPEGLVGSARWVIIGAIAVIVVLGLLTLILDRPDQRATALMGHSWKQCPWRITAFAAPVFGALVWALRHFAPTRLAVAGASAGLLAGAIGATIYGLACPETSPAFVAIWYSLGVAVCAGVGALMGRWLLRW
jgi:hypothetical protein